MKKQVKIACVNDISGIGKCSLTVALPIISSLKCQCCPVTTAVLSSQTGYPEYTFRDLSNDLDGYINVLKNLNQEFDSIYSGFLGSRLQINSVEKLINNNPNAFVIVDPVLGDHGKRFSIFDDEFVKKMKVLISKANLITPNITEANILADRQIDYFEYNESELKSLCIDLSSKGPEYIIITGFLKDSKIYNVCYDKNTKKLNMIGVEYNNVSFSGTGDIFTSIVTGLTSQNMSIEKSVKIATNFIKDACEFTVKQESYNRNDGVLFEYFLDKLVSIDV